MTDEELRQQAEANREAGAKQGAYLVLRCGGWVGSAGVYPGRDSQGVGGGWHVMDFTVAQVLAWVIAFLLGVAGCLFVMDIVRKLKRMQHDIASLEEYSFHQTGQLARLEKEVRELRKMVGTEGAA